MDELVAMEDCNFSLRNSETTLQPLREAINIVNGTIDDYGLRLILANDGFENDVDIPVYAVRSRDAYGMVAHVRQGCRAILVGSAEFDSSFTQLSEDNELIADGAKDMLAIILLHEVGHIHHGHYGQFLPASVTPSLNLDETATKVKEEQADQFVAERIKKEYEALGIGDAHLPTAMLLTFVSNLSFLVSTQATLNCFGCRVLGAPEIFWDHSQSHKNLEYRLLKLNHIILPSETSLNLLEEYERKRDNSRRKVPQIFWMDESLINQDAKNFTEQEGDGAKH